MRAEIERFLAQRRAEGLAESSLGMYRQALAGLAAVLEGRGVRRWADARPEDIDAYLASLVRLAYNSRRTYTIKALVFLRRLAEQGLVPADPARHVAIPRPAAGDMPLPEPPLSEAEVAGLLARMPRRCATDLRDIALVELLYSAGLRRSEALALDLRDLDFRNRVVLVRNGKGAKPRDLPMYRGLHGALRDWLALRRSLLRGPDHGALLLSNRGRRLAKGGLPRIFGKITRLQGPGGRRVHPHLFRHSIAVHLLRGGADIRYIQAFLGHDDLESTREYLRLVPSDLRKAYDEAMPEIPVTAG